MQKITPFLWFDNQAEEAAQFYISVFSGRKDAKKPSKILEIACYEEEGAEKVGKEKGTVMCVNFSLEGQEFVGLNGGPRFNFTEAVSFAIDCKDQEEVDYFWEKLCEGGEPSMCGWLKDKYGLSWQVVPTVLNKWLQDKDVQKAKRVMKAMLSMSKIDIAILKKAREGKGEMAVG